METVLYVEINAVGLAVLAIILHNSRASSWVNLRQKAFSALAVCMMATLVADSGMWILDGKSFAGARLFNQLVSWVYYFFNFLVPFLWFRYVALFFGVPERVMRKYALPALAPLAASAALLVANLFTEVFYTVSAQNVYERGRLFFLGVFVSYAYMAAALALSVYSFRRQNARIKKKECGVMILALALPFAGSAIQVLYYGLSLIWISVVLSMLMIFVNFQNRQISTDSLTGLNNRHQFDKYMQTLLEKNPRSAGCTLMMLDVDHFKSINDCYGHVEGDKALAAVAEALKKALVGARAFLSRYGGDEFAIVCEEGFAGEIQARVRQSLTNLNAQSRAPYALTVSIGTANFASGQGEEADLVIARADQSMYAAKSDARK